MRPATMLAVFVGLLSLAMLVSGYLMPALLAALFAVLAFVSRGTHSNLRRGSNDDYVPDPWSANSSTSTSAWNDCRDDSDRDTSDRCDSRDDGNDSGNDCDSGGDSGGSDGGGGD